ncbi:MAG: hypothetical protein EOP35_20580 [Rubrivivax sp.]|nr:MAG: hypothetical protein EOP35_20580 [Rubrivivax sp.]
MRLAHAQGADVVVPYALPQFGPVSTCLRWLQMEAVLASDARQAHVAWERADAFIRHVAAGAQTLIGQAIAWSWITRHQVLLAQWAARQPPGDGALPAAWLKPYPERILQPRFWMAAESHFGRETTADIGNRSEAMFGAEPNPLQRWAGLLSLGYLPELTRQMLDEQWLAQVRAQGELQGAALARSARSEPEPEPETMSGWSAMRWRNTVGGILVDVARPHFRPYVLRQADVALYQTALGLSQQLNGLPAAERLARLQGQALEVGIRERLSLEGDALLIRTWRGDAEPAESAPVRFPLRPA